MKKTAILFALILSLPLYAETALHLSFEPLFGIKYGTLGEYLYEADSGGDYQKKSYLEWEVQPEWYMGGKVNAEYGRLNFSLRLTGAFSNRCGSMYDSDWVDLNSVKNDYSISENTIKSDVDTEFDFSYTFKPLEKLHLSPVAGFEFDYISLSAENGYGWYGDKEHSKTGSNVAYTSSDAHFYKSGQLYGIDYARQTYAIWLGCTVSYLPFKWLTLNAVPAVAPYMISVSKDCHYGSSSNSYYMDISDGFFCAFRGELSAEFRITGRFSITAACSYMKTAALKGNTYKSSSASSGYAKLAGYQGGADAEYKAVSISVKIRSF